MRRLLTALIPLCAVLPAGAQTLHLVFTDATDLVELRAVVRAMEEEGAHLPHLFPPDAAMGIVPEGVDLSGAVSKADRTVVLRDPARTLEPRLESRKDLLGVWRSLARPALPGRDDAGGDPLIDDALDLPPGEDPGVPAFAGDCSNHSGTSLYFVGDVSVGIVMPESGPASPDTETWDTARQDAVVAEIVQGCNVLATQALPWAGLDFVYDVQRSVPVDVEPILEPSSAAGAWAREAMEALGHSSAGQYVRHLREVHGTDWGVAAFVADDLNDPDNRFADGARFAFAYIGGPSLWMTYDNDGWGIDRMDTVFAHEMGHSFRALDEYASSNPSCERRGGVLGIENQNADVGCQDDDSCIMRANSMTAGSDGSDPDAPLLTGHCRWTRGQLGAWDEDGDNLADLRDVPPQSALDPILPNPVETTDIVVTGRATAKADTSEIGEDRYGGHTLNDITRVEYRLDGGAWTEADGAWGGLCAEFEVSLTGLAEGWHTLESRAVALVCEPDDVEICDPPRERTEETLPLQEFYVNTDCPDDALEQNDHRRDAPSVPSGTLSGLQICAFDQDWLGIYLRDGAWLELEASWADPAVPLEVALFDPLGAEIDRVSGAGGTALLSMAAAPGEGEYAALVMAEGEFETAYDLTIRAACIDDSLEPNGGPAGAYAPDPGLRLDLQICDGDEDWYVIGVGGGAEIDAWIDHASATGDLDLALLDGSMALLEESATMSDREEVNRASLPGGLYYLRVRGAGPTVDNRYDLSLAVDGCLDDPAENDDDQAAASPLVPGVVEGRRLCPYDDDWYRFEVSEPAFVRLLAAFVNDEGNVDLEVRDTSGSLVAGSYGSGDTEVIDVQRMMPGVYELRVFGRNGDVSPRYDLQLSVADPVLLLAERHDRDVLLDWSDIGVECYQLLRNDRPDDFAGGTEALTGLGEEGEEAQEDPSRYDDLGAVDGTRLYFYQVHPSLCADGAMTASKTFDPYPVYMPGTGLASTIIITNTGRSTIWNIRVLDEMTPMVAGFRVLEIPQGATDSSSPTGGTYGRGYVEIEGFDLGPGESGVVRVLVDPVLDSSGGPNKLTHVLRNQARVTGFVRDDGLELEILTDDPATLAWPDSTDVAIPSYGTMADMPLISIFWNQDVDIALRVEDPCGQLLGSEDASWGECNGFQGNLERFGGCGEAWPWGWTERIAWRSQSNPPSGLFRVWVRFVEDRDSGGDCMHTGPEDVVVLLEAGNLSSEWRWVVLDSSDTGWRHVIDFQIP